METTEATVEFHKLLAWHDFFVLKSAFNLELHGTKFDFVWEQRRQDQSFANSEQLSIILIQFKNHS